MRIAQTLATISALLLAAGCSTAPHNYAYDHVDTGRISYPPPRSAADTALETEVRADLNRYGDLAKVASNVQVYAQDGTVTLTGSVPTDKDRQMIETLVRNTQGVVSVNDQLQLTYP